MQIALNKSMARNKTKKFWIGTPPWIIIGSVIILVPIFIFWTFDTLKRHKEVTTVLLVEKGDALIRSFEAGDRNDGNDGHDGRQVSIAEIIDGDGSTAGHPLHNGHR